MENSMTGRMIEKSAVSFSEGVTLMVDVAFSSLVDALFHGKEVWRIYCMFGRGRRKR